MKVLRTPDVCFTNLPCYPFEPHYLNIGTRQALRIHYVDEGAADAPVVLCLHGEPSWSFLYRKMIPVFSGAGYRVLAPDLIGFGKSDKPADQGDYSYARHVNWIKEWIEALDLSGITLLAHDWGGMIGLRLLSDMPERFARASLSNTGLPTGDQKMPGAFEKWQAYSQQVAHFDAGQICNYFGRGSLTESEVNAYRAPFPDESYLAGARRFPMLVPSTPDDPATQATRAAWQVLMNWTRPMLLCFSDGDPVTAGADQPFLKLVPGAQNQPHITLHGGHFIQEEDGETWARAVLDWMAE